ncbi:MAG: hypothetical protein MR820_04640, partial [Prevotella sp.]|nr:hypothetical protein [Prevotella sp.]
IARNHDWQVYSPITYFLLPITLFILEDSTNQSNTNDQQPTTYHYIFYLLILYPASQPTTDNQQPTTNYKEI